MTIFATAPTGTGTEAAVTPTFAQTLDAGFENAWTHGLTQSMVDESKLARARGSIGGVLRSVTPGIPLPSEETLNAGIKALTGTSPDDLAPTRKLSQQEAYDRIKGDGLEGKIKVPDDGMREGELTLLMDDKRKEMARAATLARASNDIGTNIATFGAGLAAGLVDPAALPANFIPIVSPLRYAWGVANATSLAGRIAVRAGVGALEGAAGAAMIEPVIFAAQRDMQRDYGPANSFLNVVFGAATGALLHATIGTAREAIGAQTQPWRLTAAWMAEQRAAGLRPTFRDYLPMAESIQLESRLRGMSREEYEGFLERFRENAGRALKEAEKAKEAEPVSAPRPAEDPIRPEAKAAAADVGATHLAEGRYFEQGTLYAYDLAQQREQRSRELTQGAWAAQTKEARPETFQPIEQKGDGGVWREHLGLPQPEGEQARRVIPEVIVATHVAPGDTVRWHSGTGEPSAPMKVTGVSSDGRYVYTDGKFKGGIPVDQVHIENAATGDRQWSASIRWGDEATQLAGGLTRADAERVGRDGLAGFLRAEHDNGGARRKADLDAAGQKVVDEAKLAQTPERNLLDQGVAEPKVKSDADTLETPEAAKLTAAEEVERIKKAMQQRAGVVPYIPAQPRLYHGTTGDIHRFDVSRSRDNLYGPGIYLTEDPKVASEYARAGGRPQESVDDPAKLAEYFKPGNVVPAYGNANQRVIKFNTGENGLWSVTVEDVVKKNGKWVADGRPHTHATAPSWEDFDKVLGREAHPNVTVASADIRKPFHIDGKVPLDEQKNIAAAMRGTGLYSESEAQKFERFMRDDRDGAAVYRELQKLAEDDKATVNDILKASGYDGLTHIGGDIMGGGHNHRVWVAFDADKVRVGLDPGSRPKRTPEIEAFEREMTKADEEAKAEIDKSKKMADYVNCVIANGIAP